MLSSNTEEISKYTTDKIMVEEIIKFLKKTDTKDLKTLIYNETRKFCIKCPLLISIDMENQDAYLYFHNDIFTNKEEEKWEA